MWRTWMVLGVGALATGLALNGAVSAGAANTATFRDCALAGGVDPDFVVLSGVTVGPGGTLAVPAGQAQVTIEASESSDPGDNQGHDTLKVKVKSHHLRMVRVSGAAQGKVRLSVPLGDSKTGRSYTISWMATFDNGFHHCPSKSTPENATPKPFVVVVQ
jgi:hypothetical protein